MVLHDLVYCFYFACVTDCLILWVAGFCCLRDNCWLHDFTCFVFVECLVLMNCCFGFA